jgi:hypothetical protein
VLSGNSSSIAFSIINVYEPAMVVSFRFSSGITVSVSTSIFRIRQQRVLALLKLLD